MNRYMLICVCEREIEEPKFFDTYEEAHNAMCKDFADVMGLTYEEVMETYHECEEIDYACINPENAWCERHHNNYDWKIFYV